MKVILFGASGMVGQGVLRECLLDPEVSEVLSVVRRPTGQRSEKLREVALPDVGDLSTVEAQLRGYDACFWCLGVSSAGRTEADYRTVTYDLTVRAATTLARLTPTMTFVYVSGAGTDSTEHGRAMWARVKGATENALLRLPFRAAYMFRPGIIRPLHGIRSKTRSYRVLYTVMRPFLFLVRLVSPDSMTCTDRVGRAMIAVARQGAPQPLIGTREINALALGTPS
ncbi:MAG: NAD(P)H-binding protein [Thermoplasmata archaeon]